MVYCTKCGTKNDEGASHCTKCGANLEVSREERFERRMEEWGEQFGKRVEKECFGLPHGGAIAGLVFGAIIIIAGLLFALQEWNVIEEIDWNHIWPFIIIIFGILVVAGAIYGYSRRS